MNKEQAKAWLPLIQAVAEGKTLQGKYCDMWYDAGGDSFNKDASLYRIKPEPKKQWYRVGICKNLAGNVVTFLFQNDALEFGFENSPGFIRWLTDRIEYELPEVEA